jgi:hypothetical protein
LPGDIPSRVVLSSVSTRWNDVLLEQHRLPSSELADLTYKRHVVAINIGHSSTWEFKKEGQFRRFFKEESLSCSGELNRAFGAEEQLYFQFFLERFDLVADSGLSNVKLFCCSGEALLFGDGREGKKITEFHFGSVIDSTDYSNRKTIFHKSQRRAFSWLTVCKTSKPKKR